MGAHTISGETYQQHFEIGEGASLAVIAVNGNVVVDSGPPGTITVRATGFDSEDGADGDPFRAPLTSLTSSCGPI